MLKKYGWIVALLAALAIVFVGCGGNKKGPDGGEDIVGPDSFTLVLGDNFQYGHGYQTDSGDGDPHISLFDYFSGQVKVGEEFTISFKVKADRDLENPLDFGMVDPTATANYWRPLTEPETVGPKEDEDGNPPASGWLKANTEASISIETWTATATSAGAGTGNNLLYFQTSGTCNIANCETVCDWTKAQGNLGAGVKGNVTLTFTDFKLTRKGAAADDCCTDCDTDCKDCIGGDCNGKCEEECCLPPDIDLTGTKAVIKLGDTAQDITIELGGGQLPTGAVAEYLGDNSGFLTYSAGYGSAFAQFEVDFGTGGSLNKYESVSFTLNGVSGDVNYKDVGIAAFTAKYTDGYLGFAGDEPNAAVIGAYKYNADMEDLEVTITFNKTSPAGEKLWIAIGIHGGTAKYTISNIVFNLLPEGHIPVTGISGIPTAAKVNDEIDLSIAQVTPPAATNKTIVWSVKTAGAGITAIGGGNKITGTSEGTVVITATIANGLTETTAYTQDFSIVFTEAKTLPSFTDATLLTISGKNIEFSSGKNDFSLLSSAKYLVLLFEGSNTNTDGFGRMQIAIQHSTFDSGSGPGSGWSQVESSGWTDFSNDGTELVYVVYELAQHPKFTDAAADAGSDAKLVLNSGYDNLLAAYITDEVLTTVGMTAHGSNGFFITRTPGLTEE